MELACKFKLERETKGALRYQEVDDNGVPLEPPSLHVLGSP
jgi:hypothetical protein